CLTRAELRYTSVVRRSATEASCWAWSLPLSSVGDETVGVRRSDGFTPALACSSSNAHETATMAKLLTPTITWPTSATCVASMPHWLTMLSLCLLAVVVMGCAEAAPVSEDMDTFDLEGDVPSGDVTC